MILGLDGGIGAVDKVVDKFILPLCDRKVINSDSKMILKWYRVG